MAFWSGVTLAARLPKLIEGFDKKNIDCAAYTLRIGPAIYVSPSTSAEAATRTKVVLDERQDFVIPPGQFAFLLTEERVTVPSSAVAFISMKAGVKFKGLVNVSGFHVDPGYSGRLVFGVYNAGPATVHLARGDDCFLIWYASLDCESGGYVRQRRHGTRLRLSSSRRSRGDWSRWRGCRSALTKWCETTMCCGRRWPWPLRSALDCSYWA